MAENESVEELSRHELLVQNQKKEKKILQAKIQALKHSLPKGDKKKKKDVLAEISKLEVELKEKHEKELKELASEENTNTEIELEDGNTVQPNGIDTTVEVADSKIEKVSKAQRRKDKKALKEKERDERIANQEIVNLTGVRNIEAEKLKKILETRGLEVYEVPSDGNCMYKAIEHQLSLRDLKMDSDSLRKKTAEFMRNHPDDFMPFLTSPKTGDAMTPDEFDHFCNETAKTTVWGGQLELRALSHLLKTPIEVLQAEGSGVVIGQEYAVADPLIISYHRHAFRCGEHYNSVKLAENVDNECDQT